MAKMVSALALHYEKRFSACDTLLTDTHQKFEEVALFQKAAADN